MIHVAGASGSGKSTLGAQLAARWPTLVHVVDTDEFIQPHNAAGARLDALRGQPEYTRVWRQAWDEGVRKAREHRELVIFVGLTDNYGPGDVYYELPVQHRLLLTVSKSQLARQYYGRVAREDEGFWANVDAGTQAIPGSNELFRWQREVDAWHLEHGYRAMSAAEITEFVRKQLFSVYCLFVSRSSRCAALDSSNSRRWRISASARSCLSMHWVSRAIVVRHAVCSAVKRPISARNLDVSASCASRAATRVLTWASSFARRSKLITIASPMLYSGSGSAKGDPSIGGLFYPAGEAASAPAVLGLGGLLELDALHLDDHDGAAAGRQLHKARVQEPARAPILRTRRARL
jgi:hypothetical protein